MPSITSVLFVLYSLSAQIILGTLGPLLAAATAVAVVNLTNRGTRVRDADGRAHQNRQQQVDQERAAVVQLVSAIHPWHTAVQTHYAHAWIEHHPNSGQHVVPFFLERAARDTEAFTAALWNARMTVHNHLARPLLDRLRETYKEFSALVNNIDHDHNKHKEEGDLMEGLMDRLDVICEELEAAVLNWDGPPR